MVKKIIQKKNNFFWIIISTDVKSMYSILNDEISDCILWNRNPLIVFDIYFYDYILVSDVSYRIYTLVYTMIYYIHYVSILSYSYIIPLLKILHIMNNIISTHRETRTLTLFATASKAAVSTISTIRA